MVFETSPRSGSLRLAPFLRQERASILRAWEEADREFVPAEGMSREELLNHIPELLDEIADLVEEATGGAREVGLSRHTPRAHAWHRLQREFSLEQVAWEYALLRKAILRRLAPQVAKLDAGELVLLNESLDRAITEAVMAYTQSARQQLEEERQRLEQVLEFLPAAVLIAHAPEGKLSFGNREVERVLGHAFLPARDVSEYGAYRAYHLDHRGYAPGEYPMARALAGERVVREEMYYQRGDGGWSYLHVSATPIFKQGRIASAVLCMADLTEAKRLEDERRRLEERVRQRADFERQLIGIVSHDLRNPLSAITLGAASLLRRPDLDMRQSTTVTRILDSAQRAQRMIRDLLDFTQARLGSGIPVSVQAMDVHALTAQVVDEARSAHPERRFDMKSQGEGQGAWDADRLNQVLTNLLTNAIQHSPTSTPVTVRSLVDGDRVRLEVHNLGAPLPEELRARLFLPLERGVGKAMTDRTGRSIGLGLYIVKSIATAHGGDVQVRSSAEEGTTFIVDLPRRSVEP